MKAVVLEVRDGEAAILTMDGSVRRVRGHYEVGQEIDWGAPARPSVLQWVAAMAAAAVLLTGSAGLWFSANYVACAEVSLDVNPSITYTLNRRDRVLSVTAVNTEAEAIVEALRQDDIRFMPIGDALEATLDALTREGYLDSASEDYVLAGVSADSESAREGLSQKVADAMERAMQSDPTLEYQIERTDRATAREAKAQGMSAGRYAAWRDAGDGRAPSDFAEMPVQEIFGKGAPDAPDDSRPGERSEDPPEAREPANEPAADQSEARETTNPSVDSQPGNREPANESIDNQPENRESSNPSVDSPPENREPVDQASGADAPARNDAPANNDPPARNETPSKNEAPLGNEPPSQPRGDAPSEPRPNG